MYNNVTARYRSIHIRNSKTFGQRSPGKLKSEGKLKSVCTRTIKKIKRELKNKSSLQVKQFSTMLVSKMFQNLLGAGCCRDWRDVLNQIFVLL